LLAPAPSPRQRHSS